MSEKCILSAQKQGEITKEEADSLIERYNNLKNTIESASGDPLSADYQAKQMLINAIRSENDLKKVRLIRQNSAMDKLDKYLDAEYNNQIDMKTLVDSIFSPDFRNRFGTEILSLERRTEQMRRQAGSFYSRAIADLPRKFNGEVEDEMERKIYQEIVGISTGDKIAKSAAEGFKKALDYVSDRYQMAGGRLSKMDNYDLKHSHSVAKILKVTGQEWIDFIMPLLDREKMLNKTTSLPLNDTELRSLLSDIYLDILTDGRIDTKANITKPSVANRWGKERVLHFTADNWFEYNERFGETGAVSSIIHQITNMSRDTAQMETFGPNVELGKQFLKNQVKVQMVENRKFDNPTLREKVLGETDFDTRIDQWFDIANGNAFGKSNPKTARYFDNMRGFLAAAQLGSAALSSVTDFGNMLFAAKFNDIPAVKLTENYFKSLFGSGGKEMRTRAGELGLVIEHLHANILEQIVSDVQLQKSIGGIAASKVIKYSGLERHTDAGRVALSLSFAQETAKNFSKTFDELDKGFKRGLEQNGIGANEWDVIRNTKTIDYDGVRHLNLSEVERADLEIGGKLAQYIYSEVDKGMITSSWQFDKALQSTNLKGQWARTVALYKRYPVVQFMTMFGRFMNDRISAGEKTSFALQYIPVMTLLGASALTLKDIANGREPRDWTSPAFLRDSFLQSGVGGLYADFLKQSIENNKNGRFSEGMMGATNFVFGPIVSLGKDLIYSPFIEPLANKSSEPYYKMAGRNLTINSMRYVPGNNLWYTKLLVDRAIKDNITKMVDPNADRSFNRIIETRKQNYDQGFYIKPGDWTK